MLIRLIAVDSNHVIRYKCKITHCLDSRTLSKYISTIDNEILNDNETISINEVLEVLICVRTVTNTSSFDTQSLQFVTMNELKKSMSGGQQVFIFYMVIQYSVYFLLEFEANYTR